MSGGVTCDLGLLTSFDIAVLIYLTILMCKAQETKSNYPAACGWIVTKN